MMHILASYLKILYDMDRTIYSGVTGLSTILLNIRKL